MFILLLIATIYIYNYLNTNNNGSGGIRDLQPNIDEMPESTLLLVNNTGNELNVFLQEKLGDPSAPVFVKWDFLNDNNCTIKIYPDKDKPAESSDAIGDSGVIVNIPLNKDPSIKNWCTLKIPDTNGNAMRISPVVIVNVNGKRTMLSKYFQGEPSLIEFGKDMVGNMSIEDGTTYNMSLKMSIDKIDNKDTYTTINYNGNPCTYKDTYSNGQPEHTDDSYDFQNFFLPGTNPKNLFGCLVGNPYGTFIVGKNADSSPYYHLTGNLNNGRKKWCDEVQKGQCNRDIKTNSDENCKTTGQFPDVVFDATTCTGCFSDGNHTKFTTYCYDFNDKSSQPYFRSPFKMQVLFKNLGVEAHLESVTIPNCIKSQCGSNLYSRTIVGGDDGGCTKFLNEGVANMINVCYQNGGPTPSPEPLICADYTPTCPKDSYWCPTTKICSTTITKCVNECKSKGESGSTYPNCTAPYPPCAIGFYACYHEELPPDCAVDPKIFIDYSYNCTSICHNVR
jgi:hypothetical protein